MYNEGKYIKIVKSYLRERSILAGIFTFIVLIFFALCGLYGYDNSVANMSYAVIIILFFGIAAGIVDLIHYGKRCLQLMEAASKQEESDYFLPEAKGLPEMLYQEMLIQTENDKRKLISELDENKRDMADYYTMWIHQIKTPIAALNLLLQQSELNKKQTIEELFKIEQYAEMALSYARLDSLSSDLLLKRYDIYEIVKRAVKKYSVLFIGSGLSFSMEEFTCMAVTDEKWLSFVIEQILSNALKYTKEGTIRIAALQDKAGSLIVIEDTGIGISESDLPRIYERGFTGYNGRMDKKSTGIGLYLCKEICRRLSHTIQVESKLGKGTRVMIGFCQEKDD